MAKLPKLPIAGSKRGAGADAAARAKKAAARKAAAAKRGNPLANRGNPLTKLASDAARRAEGRIARQPGSGDVIETDPRSKKAMVKTYTAFLKGARDQDLAPLEPFLTKRLHGSLEKNLPKYKDRFFNGLRDSIAALKGGMEIRETRDMGRGNVEALVRFENGHERRVIFFKEDGQWKLNRL